MAWPHPPDYNEAVQNPRHCFADPELQQGWPALNPLGLPWPRSGNSADVYKIITPEGQAWAVKCFTREVRGLRERYQAISAYLRKQPLPFMVDFRYQEPGIKVNGQWFPVLKMRWVDGLMLNELAREYAGKPVILDRLADMWVRLSQEMRHAQLIHGDLQHGNVLLVPTGSSGTLRLRLVDYDGMVIPGLADHPPDEVGHPNYQHPQRLSHGNPDTDLDRFAHLVIYSALRCLVIGGRALLERYDNSDNLLFREQDFRAPAASKILHELWDTKHPVARSLVGYLVLTATGPVEKVPKLSSLVKRGQLRFLSGTEESRVEEVLAAEAPAELAVPPADVGREGNNAGAVRSLVAALGATDARVRADAADSLAALGPRARDAVAALREALNDRDVHVRHSAAQALWAIEPLP
jgi:HEAT repeats